jgi:hypothetical protein
MVVFYQVFLLLREFEEKRKRLREFEEIKSQGKAEVTVNSKEENSFDFCLDFVWISAQSATSMNDGVSQLVQLPFSLAVSET